MFTESVVAELPSLEPFQGAPDSNEEFELFAPEPMAAPRGRPRLPGERLPAGALSPVGFDGPRLRPPGSPPNAPPLSLLRSSAGLDPLRGAPALSMQPMKGRLNLPAPPPAAAELSAFAPNPTDLADTQPPPFDAELADSLLLSTSIPPSSPAPELALPAPVPVPTELAATQLALEAPAAPTSDAPAAQAAGTHASQAEQSARAASPATTSERAAEPLDGPPDSARPAKERRADARRAARRKSAKSLPPPAARAPLRWSPTQIGLAAFGGGLLVLALGLGSALAGLWSLPPSAAEALGLRDARGSLAAAAPAAPSQTKDVARPQPTIEPTTAVWPPVVNRPASPAAPAPQAKPAAAAPEPGSGSSPPAAAATRPLSAVQPAAPSVAAPAVAVAQPIAESPSEAGIEPTDRRKLLIVARSRVNNGDALGAVAMLERAVARDPDDHHLQDGLAQALLALGKGQEALGYAAKIIKKRPRRPAYRLLEGDAYLLLGKRVEAVSSWRVALELDPNNGEAKRRLGR